MGLKISPWIILFFLSDTYKGQTPNSYRLFRGTQNFSEHIVRLWKSYEKEENQLMMSFIWNMYLINTNLKLFFSVKHTFEKLEKKIFTVYLDNER